MIVVETEEEDTRRKKMKEKDDEIKEGKHERGRGRRTRKEETRNKKQEQEEDEVMSISSDEIDAAYSPGGEATRMTMVMIVDEIEEEEEGRTDKAIHTAAQHLFCN